MRKPASAGQDGAWFMQDLDTAQLVVDVWAQEPQRRKAFVRDFVAKCSTRSVVDQGRQLRAILQWLRDAISGRRLIDVKGQEMLIPNRDGSRKG